MAMPTCYSNFLMREYEGSKESYPAVGLLRQKIYAAKSQQQDLALVRTDIYFMVTNSTVCSDGALIRGALQMKFLVYTQY